MGQNNPLRNPFQAGKEAGGLLNRLIRRFQKKPFAVFAVYLRDGKIAVTTRPDGRIGLPGGKVDPGESALDAIRREAFEEGWELVIPDSKPIHRDVVEGREVWWFAATNGRELTRYKEAYRGIIPTWSTVQELVEAGPGLGNEFLMARR